MKGYFLKGSRIGKHTKHYEKNWVVAFLHIKVGACLIWYYYRKGVENETCGGITGAGGFES